MPRAGFVSCVRTCRPCLCPRFAGLPNRFFVAMYASRIFSRLCAFFRFSRPSGLLRSCRSRGLPVAASRWRGLSATALLAVAIACVLLPVTQLHAQGSPSTRGGRQPQLPKPVNEAEGRQIIERFRAQRLSGDFFFVFELVQMPRRGPEKAYAGLMWGTWTNEGPLTRVAVWEPEQREQTMRQFIILSGRTPRAWVNQPDGSVRELDEAQMIEPLLPDLLYTPFDLAMPFVYWDASYIGPDRVRGRRAQIFLMSAPEAVRAVRPQWDQVLIALDDEFNALLRAEIVDAGRQVLRSFRIRSFKEVSGQYIIKGVDLVDEVSREKTRFEVIEAGVGLRLPQPVFAPSSLGNNALPQLPAIATERL